MDLLIEWIWQAISLFAGTFVHEDAAVLAGAYLVVSKGLPPGLAFAALVAGVIAGDLLIYAMGRGARRIKWLRGISRRVENSRFSDVLDRRLIMAIAAARIMPTMAFPLFAACGVSRINIGRFLLASVATAIVYVGAVFGLMLAFGKSLPSWATGYGWIGIAVLVVAVWVLRRWWSSSRDKAEDIAASRRYLTVHKGMPALPSDKVRVALQERIQTHLFYVPQTVQWFWLALRHGGLTIPTLANPHIPTGGLMGESKSDCMAMVDPSMRGFLMRTGNVDERRPEEDPESLFHRAKIAARNAGIDYPLVVKPDLGWRGWGVRLVENDEQLRAYVNAYPADVRMMVQEYSEWHGEAAIFYVRRPGAAKGDIYSMTFRYFPFVIGDGVTPLRNLILANGRMRWKKKVLFAQHAERLDWVPSAGEEFRLAMVGSNRVGGLYVDGGSYVTEALTDRIESLAQVNSRVPFRPLRRPLPHHRCAPGGSGLQGCRDQRRGVRGGPHLGSGPATDGSLPRAVRAAGAHVPDRRRQPETRLPSDEDLGTHRLWAPAEPSGRNFPAVQLGPVPIISAARGGPDAVSDKEGVAPQCRGHFKRRLTPFRGRMGPVLRICLIRAVCGVKPACRCPRTRGHRRHRLSWHSARLRQTSGGGNYGDRT